jgi:hypothetical protein
MAKKNLSLKILNFNKVKKMNEKGLEQMKSLHANMNDIR